VGELLLCNHSIAAMPYYIEAISLNIYSLEELCYVIEHHAFLMEESFFEEELLLWIEREVGASQLAEELRQALQNELGVTKLVECILNETGYLSYAEGLDVISQIRQMQHKSVFERRKMRADRYVENKKYISALLEYRRILLMEEECKQNPVMCGNIWHNQGVVFSRLFLFREAKECFEKAYQYHMNMESVYEAMAACCFVGEEEVVDAWFGGFWPAEEPEYVIVVYSAGGGSGAEAAVPVFHRIADHLCLRRCHRIFNVLP